MRNVLIFLAVVLLAGLVWKGGPMFESEGPQVAFLRKDASSLRNYVTPALRQGASEEYITAMLWLQARKVPSVASLRALGPLIDRKFGASPRGVDQFGRYYNLLDHALIYTNIDGVRALLEAGADPNLSSYLFATTALPGPMGTPDWTTSPPILQLYLDHGGRIDYGMPDDPDPMLSYALSNGNYDGAKFLLEKGANPWIEIRGLDPNYPPKGSDLYPITDITGGVANGAAFLIWFQEQGYLEKSPEPMIALFFDNALDSIDAIAAGQTMLDLETIRLNRDLLEGSLSVKSTYRLEERKAAVEKLTAYVTQQEGRP